jgi:phosphate transport system permease protein
MVGDAGGGADNDMPGEVRRSTAVTGGPVVVDHRPSAGVRLQGAADPGAAGPKRSGAGDEGPPASLPPGGGQRADRLFRRITAAAGGLVLLVMAAIGAFLIWKAVPAFSGNAGNLILTQQWLPQASPPMFGIAAIAFGTLVTSLIAALIAVPVSVGVAMFIAHYAGRRLATVLGGLTDLLAAVPSLVFGMWGLYFLIPNTRGFQAWLSEYLGWIPLFRNTIPGVTTTQFGQSLLMAGIVLAIMIIPTISAITREVFRQVPGELMDAARALGATRWEVMRTAVLPFGRPGVISAAMLGLGRALGETIAVALVLNSGIAINWHLTEPGGDTLASTNALKLGEATSSAKGIPALVFAGLCLFAITLLVNSAARLIVARRKEFR